jgi:hypothetical protein
VLAQIDMTKACPQEASMGTAAFALLMMATAAYIAHLVVAGLRTGIIDSRGTPVPRKTQPIGFWMLVVVYCMACPVAAGSSLLFFRLAWLGCPMNSTIHTCNPFSGILQARTEKGITIFGPDLIWYVIRTVRHIRPPEVATWTLD